MSSDNIHYLVIDTETVTDENLVARQRFPELLEEGMSPTEIVQKWKEELKADGGRDFIPYTYQVPTAIALGKVSDSYELLDVAALSEVSIPASQIVERFWRGWERYGRPTFVTFNGRSFDMPILELSAFRYGLSLPGWFSPVARNYDQPRSRYNQSSHIDLMDILTNFGATRFPGGLNLAANLIGKPGKMEVSGEKIAELHTAGEFQMIEDYCRCDVLDTYFVFLRTRVMMGYLTLTEEQKLVKSTRKWLEKEAENRRAYQIYLEHWGNWENPWKRK